MDCRSGNQADSPLDEIAHRINAIDCWHRFGTVLAPLQHCYGTVVASFELVPARDAEGTAVADIEVSALSSHKLHSFALFRTGFAQVSLILATTILAWPTSGLLCHLML